MTITIPKSGIIDLHKFNKLLDITRVIYYTLEERDGCLCLQFFDKNKKAIKFYAKEKVKKPKKAQK